MKENSSIYGPVNSWRLGVSLGVDVILIDSICSFECIYCQLGKINRVETNREVFVKTSKIISDLEKFDWQNADVITFSGSGEPTLALNLGEAIDAIKEKTGKEIIVLTNSTLLFEKEVRDEISKANRIFCKLDGWNSNVIHRIDRPTNGITFDKIISGIAQLRKEFTGILAIQTMVMRKWNDDETKRFAEIINRISPDEVQLNIPTRPIPTEYAIETRGNLKSFTGKYHKLKTIDDEALEEVATRLAALTNAEIVTH
ncbi:MAG: radical SAM protein [Pyrinomonadaceae bacterium]